MCFKGCCPGFHQITTSYNLLEHWQLQILPEMVSILFHFSKAHVLYFFNFCFAIICTETGTVHNYT